jgi:ribonuclease HII
MKDEEAALQTIVAREDEATANENVARDSSGGLHPSTSRRRRVSLIGTAFEDEARSRGFKLIAGVDEVGRGALAGPVVAAAVILNPEAPLPAGLDDSKKLTAKARERIAEELRQSVVAYSVGLVGPDEIDRINILEATRRAMLDALVKLEPCADFVLIDALQLKACELPQRAIIRGDSVSASIAAASVIAKTYRDHLMHELHDLYPHYNFSKHVGYGTREHLAALRAHGCCPVHRRSFRGVLPEELRAEG